MSDAPSQPARTLRRSNWPALAAFVLLSIYAAMSLGAALHKGASFDEQEELAVGYQIWTHHDFRMEGANGDLIKRWATLPYLFTRPTAAATDNDYWQKARAYRFGYEFFFQSGNAPEWLLLQGRAMAVLGVVVIGFPRQKLADHIAVDGLGNMLQCSIIETGQRGVIAII